jgi:hypothetical protein
MYTWCSRVWRPELWHDQALLTTQSVGDSFRIDELTLRCASLSSAHLCASART